MAHEDGVLGDTLGHRCKKIDPILSPTGSMGVDGDVPALPAIRCLNDIHTGMARAASL